MEVCFEKIPACLKERRQWVMWKIINRDGKDTKVPLRCNDGPAKSNDPSTWADFDEVAERLSIGNYSGIGYMFAADDPFCGIDLDGCRAPDGKIAEWARDVIKRFASYSEVSPSMTGVKIFCRGQAPFTSGKKIAVPGATKVGDKEPAIEVYDKLRYFAVTGLRLAGFVDLTEAGEPLAWLKKTYWPEEPSQPQENFHSDIAVFERARKYTAKMPASVSGQGGHNNCFHAACVLVLGFQLSDSGALALLLEFNQRCDPPWSEKELLHKVQQAQKQPGPRGYLRNAKPDNWDKISVPKYEAPRPRAEPRQTTLGDAARKYLDTVRTGKTELISLCLPELDYALGGGVQKGEMILFCARPSHGKSMAALQSVHQWTGEGRHCAILSQEMSAIMLGRRTLQYLSPLPEEHWYGNVDTLAQELDNYENARAKCTIIEDCGRTDMAVETIAKLVKEKGIECAVIDYAQLLQAPGKTRYEQVTNTSLMLRGLASQQNIVLLVLCAMSRDIERRKGAFAPTMADIKETGQLEQDADVVSFLCWPNRIDQSEPADKYQFFIAKNRNRPINQHCVNCRFTPARQRLEESVPHYVSQPADDRHMRY